jgi:hypothetical protein
VADALSRRPHLLHLSLVNFAGFDSIKMQYAGDVDFGSTWSNLSTKTNVSSGEYSLHEGCLFYGTQLCIPHGLMGHFASS